MNLKQVIQNMKEFKLSEKIKYEQALDRTSREFELAYIRYDAVQDTYLAFMNAALEANKKEGQA